MLLRIILMVFAVLAFSTGAEEIKKIQVAFLGGFTSSMTNTALTDLNYEKGMKVFLMEQPEAAKRLEIVKFDNQGDAAKTAEVMSRIADNGIRYVIGISKSNQALAAVPVVQSRQLFLFTPFTSHDRVTKGNPNVFRICYADSYAGAALANFALKQLKAKRILVLTNVDEVYSVGLAERFKNVIGKKVPVSEVSYGTDDMHLAEIQKIVTDKKAPDLVFLPDYVNTAGKLARDIYKINPKLKFLGGDGWGGREILNLYLSELKDIKAYYAAPWSESLTTPENKRFLESFKKAIPDQSPSVGSAIMYDAMQVFWQALSKAGFPSDPEPVKKQLLSSNFRTTVGTLRFPDANDPSPVRDVMIIRFRSGRHELFQVAKD